jgi:alkanesulfonate monooxygenase SsuD/methylene tetrahydromethanopterin reductase-like flavin-dependent oxidoreductase (luciferase family)
MSEISLRFDMRASPQGASHQHLYSTALDMAVYADQNGFYSVTLSEHHGVEDGYLPSPIVLAAAIASLTKRLRLDFKAIIAPLHDPLRLAEDLAVLDQISGGRVQATLAGGYNPREFAMFGKSLTDRGACMEDIVGILTAAWTGEPFQYRGETVRVTPLPVQRPRLPLLMGGSSVAAARRAGRLADGFVTHREDLYEIYAAAAREAGKMPLPFAESCPGFIHITRDPEAAWEMIAPHALQEMNSYGQWIAESGSDGRFKLVSSIEELKASGSYIIVTPEAAVPLARQFKNLTLHPLMGGLDPEIGWRSLRLFVDEVLPAL